MKMKAIAVTTLILGTAVAYGSIDDKISHASPEIAVYTDCISTEYENGESTEQRERALTAIEACTYERSQILNKFTESEHKARQSRYFFKSLQATNFEPPRDGRLSADSQGE